MPFVTACTFCPQRLTVPNQAMGACVRCPKCGNHFTVAPMEVEQCHDTSLDDSSPAFGVYAGRAALPRIRHLQRIRVSCNGFGQKGANARQSLRDSAIVSTCCNAFELVATDSLEKGRMRGKAPIRRCAISPLWTVAFIPCPRPSPHKSWGC